jgi:diaminohydroxyphosphoribosylaminopyrimidine deaminase/5-amino-6-(5-phosphoribosylamino)uracil reductase
MAEWDLTMMQRAIKLSKRCPHCQTAYAVGCLVVAADGTVLAQGYSRQTGPGVHAEEVALAEAAEKGLDLSGATLYSSMEPCGKRLSGNLSCADRILQTPIRRVVFALREPPLFVTATGENRLRDHGLEVVVLSGLGPLVRAVNGHLLGDDGP